MAVDSDHRLGGVRADPAQCRGAQPHLQSLGTLGATLVRFLYGLPFALVWLAGRPCGSPACRSRPRAPVFLGWVTLGAVAQIGATAFLLRTMAGAQLRARRRLLENRSSCRSPSSPSSPRRPGQPHRPVRVACAHPWRAAALAGRQERPLRALLAGLDHGPALLGLASGTGLRLCRGRLPRRRAAPFEHVRS